MDRNDKHDKHDKLPSHHAPSHEDRKRALLRDAEYYRAGLTLSRDQIKHAAKPEVMFHTVLDHATWALRTRADALLRPTGTSITALAPYAMTVLSFIRRRRLGKQALAASAVVGAIGWYVQRKRAQQVAY